MAQARAGYIPNCLFRVEKAQGQSIRKDLFLTQFHDNKVNYNLLRIEDYCASSTPIPFWGAG